MCCIDLSKLPIESSENASGIVAVNSNKDIIIVEPGGSSVGDVNVVDGFGSNSTTDASSINNATVLKNALDALDGSAIKYNSDGNIEIHTGTKILGTENTGVEDVMLWLASYIVDQVTYQQLEVGSSHIHLNLNTNTDMYYGIRVTVDTPEGKKQIAYIDDLPSLSSFVDLSSDQTIGGNKTFTGNINSAGSILFPSKGNIGSNNFRAGTLYADDVMTTNRPKVGNTQSSENVALVSDLSSRVTVNTDQDITGKKNFTSQPTINGVNIATQDQNARHSEDLSEIGKVLEFTFGLITCRLTRISTTEIKVELSASSDIVVDIVSTRFEDYTDSTIKYDSVSIPTTGTELSTILITNIKRVDALVYTDQHDYRIIASGNSDYSRARVNISQYA